MQQTARVYAIATIASNALHRIAAPALLDTMSPMILRSTVLLLGSTEGVSPGLGDLLIILAAASLVALVMQRLRLAVIPAYLLTGIIIGPGGLGLIDGPERVRAISDLALILLMFGIGLHLDLSLLRLDLRRLITTGSAAVLLCIVALLPIILIFEVSVPTGLAIALALTMSSTAVVLRIIQQRRELHHQVGRLTFATLIIQDLVAIVSLMILPVLARWNGTGSPGPLQHVAGDTTPPIVQLLLSAGIAVAGITALVLVGRLLLPRLLREAARQHSGEAMIVISTAIALGAAALTNALGISPALGAFLAGFLLSSTPFRHHLSGQIGTIRDLFSAVFFTAIGMSVGLGVVVDHLGLIVVGAIALLAVKAVAIALASWLAGATGNLAIRVGLVLCQAGEFGIVILHAAGAADVALVSADQMTQIVAVIVLTLMATPAIISLAPTIERRLGHIPPPRWTSNRAHDETPDGATPDPDQNPPLCVIVAGFGLVGRAVADSLTGRGAIVTIVETNPTTVRTQAQLGRRIIFGDVSNPDVLESAGVHEADALVLTFPDEVAVLRACQSARSAHPDLVIIVRTNFVGKGMAATQLGADAVVVEEIATAKAMEREVLRHLGPMLPA